MKRAAKVLFIALLVFVLYEVFAVLKARSNTVELFSSVLQSNKIELNLQDLSEQQTKALLAVEDPNFYAHSGVDFFTAGSGLTTITQAMTKYLYFENFKAGFKKIEQSLIAWLAVTPMISKDDQLTVFINTAYLGHVDNKEIQGFAEASRNYLGKPFNELTETEYLSIVAMLLAPKTFSIKNHPDRNAKRVTLIKALLKGEYVPTGNGDLLYGQKI